MSRRVDRGAILAVLAVLAALAVLTACSTSADKPGSIVAESSGPQSTTEAPSITEQPAQAADFDGPVIETCRAHGSSTTLSRLNIDTGEAVEIGTFPAGCYFDGQSDRMLYSRDFSKRVMPNTGRHVEYYDSKTGETVDVTAIVSPEPTGDFGTYKQPNDSDAQFADDGLFVYYDGNAEQFTFFDTDSKKVVRTGPTYLPHYLRVLLANAADIETGKYRNADRKYRPCANGSEWVVNDTQYLGRVQERDGSGRGYLVIDTVVDDDIEDCDATAARRISPTADLRGATADPAGTTILFMVKTKEESHNLYRANLDDPENPTKIELSGPLGAMFEDTTPPGPDSPMINLLGWK